ncbi:MAG: hypothetical protein QJR03_05985 [Sphaerobacter sp.]|nr:hypothetical protein [Sphaerobacter sp.]
MQTSIFAFATDLHDEGLDVVLDHVQRRAGLDGVTLACAYHHARDVFPHNPVRKVRFLEGGTVFFRPDAARYADLKITPQVSRLAQEVDMLAELLRAAERRGLAVRGWTVFLHNTTLGSRHPECTIQNAFGDPYITSLCPANPDVRAFARALAADIAGRGVQAVLAEALAYQPFDHGYHHERAFIALSPVTRVLLSLCFCEHCLAWMRAEGVDGPRVQRFVRTAVERVFAGEASGLPEGPVELDTVAALADGELGRVLAVRQQVVTTLVAEVSEAVEQANADARLTFMDMSGAAKGYATGQPEGGPVPEIAWQDGVDVAAVGRHCHALASIGYARDPERLRRDIEAYQALLPAGTPLSVALRPMLPDCDSAENLAAKLALLRARRVAWVDFYHYGFMPLAALDRIRQALHGA